MMLLNEIPGIHLMNKGGRRNFYTRLPAPPAPGRQPKAEQGGGIVIILSIIGRNLMIDKRKKKMY
jgi:hypothetical protein